MEPKLTIGMATFEDYHGVFFTQAALRLYHPEAMRHVELVVVDNNPTSAHGQGVKNLVENWASAGTAGARYIAMPEPVGTTAPRQRVFDEARGEWVMCIDSHVLLVPGALDKLLAYFDANPESGDLLHGPLIYDDLVGYSSHFTDEWRAEMWGTWASDPRAADPAAEPFEIPGQGLGLFVCRRAAWLGFNPHFRAFGGEEMYVHEKFRQHGRRVLCLPFLRWNHRFGRPDGPKYQLSRWSKVRNYVLGHLELGLPLDRVHEHFVDGGLMREAEWQLLLADPIGSERAPSSIPTLPAGARGSIDMLFDWVKGQPRDLDRHADKIRELAADAQHVTAFVKRKEWNVFLAAGRPGKLTVHQLENDALLGAVHSAVKAMELEPAARKIAAYTTHVGGPTADSLTATIEPTDLLVLDTMHNAERLYAELARHAPQVRGRILVRGTAFGEMAEGGQGPGPLPALRRWMREHPEWSIIWHTKEQYGLTLLSRLTTDKPKLPGKLTLAKNFAQSLAAHVADNTQKTTPEQLEARLLVCTTCPHRNDNSCSVCGCGLDKKASWRSSECPLGMWPDLTTLEVPRSE